ncbi:hypothetical protein ACGC1H_003213 [Rhizoctonia solani]|uniref:F-box domain-containing protein n=1 Tax=Rhizoctonia solani TaxID=456999 RepID=A0A8H3H1A6_9AGAM|nr:unnamed protein product [Rhizoctonia solani]
MIRSLLIIYFPNEVLVHTLHHCHYRAIIRFSMTCKRIHEIVRQSVSLQLHIELDVNGFEISDRSAKTSICYSSVLEELKGYRDAWLNFRFAPVVQKRIIPNFPNMEWDIKHGACIGGFRESSLEHPQDYLLDRIQIIHLCSPVAPPPLDFKKKFNDFMVDMGQNLVVLIEYVFESPSSAFANVHLYHTTTGLPHPFAMLPTLTVRFKGPLNSVEPDILVLDNILVISFLEPENTTSGYDTLMWNWKSGLLLGRIHSETSADLSFLDRSHLIVYRSLLDSTGGPQESNQVGLHIYRVPIATTASCQERTHTEFYAPSYPTLKPILILQFPKLHKTYRLQGYTMNSVPLLGDSAYTSSTNIVYAHTTTMALQLLVAPLVVHEDEHNLGDLDYCIFVNTSRIFDYLSDDSTQETTVMLWSQWGTETTRWFIDSDSLSASAVEVFGSLYPIWDLDDPELETHQLLSIFEFNPQIVRRYMQTSGTIDQKGVLEVSGNFSGGAFTMADLKAPLLAASNADVDQDVVTHIIGSNMRTVMNKGFEEPVESNLPFMVATRVQRMPKHQAWLIEGNYLLGIPIETLDGPENPFSLYKLQITEGN